MASVVSKNALAPYFPIARSKGVAVAELLEGIDLDPARLPDDIAWDDFALITERLVTKVGIDALAEGMYADARGVFSALRIFARPNLLLRASFEWRGRSLFPDHKIDLVSLSGDRCQMRTTLPVDVKPSLAFFSLVRKLIEGIPTLLGSPPAIVHMGVTENVATYDIQFPPSNTIFDRIGRRLRALFSSRRALEMLTSQNEELDTKHKALSAARNEAEAARERAEVARDVAERALRVRSEFLAVMSHEIRTPLNGVLGATDLLGDTKLDTDQNEAVDALRASTKRLAMLLDNLLDFSQLESSQMKMEASDFSPKKLAASALGAAAASASAKKLTLSVESAEIAHARVTADESRIRQVLTTLLDNAIKFTNDGGVTVCVRVLASAGGPCMLRFEVRDSGVGIAAADIARVFDPFARGDTSWTRAFGGVGLGLAISQRLVGLLNGTIGATSDVGRGSVFWFEVPVKPCEGSFDEEATHTSRRLPAATESKAPTSTTIVVAEKVAQVVEKKFRVLIVDDDAVNRKIVAKLAAALGASCESVENGEIAVARVASGQFDAILMDCQMPVMDGFEATQRIRAAERDGHVRIIAVTANVEPEDRARCYAAGMDDFIAKPVKRDHLKLALDGVGADSNAPQRKTSGTRPAVRSDSDKKRDASN